MSSKTKSKSETSSVAVRIVSMRLFAASVTETYSSSSSRSWRGRELSADARIVAVSLSSMKKSSWSLLRFADDFLAEPW
jgi:hypothetical protein